MSYNIHQISKGVSSQRVEDFKKKTEKEEGKLVLKMITYIVFAISLGIIFLVYKL